MRRSRWAICRSRMPRPAHPCSPKSAASACPCRSRRCRSFPTPTNAEGLFMTTLFTDDHEWLKIDGDVATIGVTDYAQSQLGDVESVKAASDVYAPISGEVLEVNEAIAAEPALVNSDAGGKAWFFKMKIADKSELDGLMDEAAYAKHTA